MLHRYILIPKGKEGDKDGGDACQKAQHGGEMHYRYRAHTGGEECRFHRSPLPADVRNGLPAAIRGVCDLDYINIPDVKKRAALSGNTSAQNPIEDCGSSMAPDIERHHRPEPRSHPPFAFRKTAEDMASSTSCTCPSSRLPTIWNLRHWARAEWMKFYGMLFKRRECTEDRSCCILRTKGRFALCEDRKGISEAES